MKREKVGGESGSLSNNVFESILYLLLFIESLITIKGIDGIYNNCMTIAIIMLNCTITAVI